MSQGQNSLQGRSVGIADGLYRVLAEGLLGFLDGLLTMAHMYGLVSVIMSSSGNAMSVYMVVATNYAPRLI